MDWGFSFRRVSRVVVEGAGSMDKHSPGAKSPKNPAESGIAACMV